VSNMACETIVKPLCEAILLVIAYENPEYL
jgi:hypothetical protein